VALCVTDGGQRSAYAAAHAYTQTLDPAGLLCIIMVSTVALMHVITRISTHLPTAKGWKAELAWMDDPRQTVYPQICHLSSTDREQGRETPPAKGQCPNH